jgi:signal transduction histidine kinase
MLHAACTVSDKRRTLSTSAPAVTQSAVARHLPVESTGAAGDSCNWRTLALALGALLVQTDTQRVIDAEGQAVEPAGHKTAHDQDTLAGRDSIVGLVAHELKTPVAIIKAYAELLEAQLADQPPASAARGVLHHILDQADLMADWIESMLDTQRLRLGKLPLELGRVDLVQLAHTLAEEFQQMTRDHQIRVVVNGRPPGPILADRCRLRQVVTNLLANAVKYSAGGTIEVRVGAQERANGGTQIMLTVRDEGQGIDAVDLGCIFGRYAQGARGTECAREGLGVGLYLAREIARAHGGDLWAESRGRGHGSTFVLTLPLDVGGHRYQGPEVEAE